MDVLRADIKADEVAAQKSAEAKLKESVDVKASTEEAPKTEIKTVSDINSEVKTLTADAVPTATVEVVVPDSKEAVTTEIAVVAPADDFDTAGKIKEAESMLRKAEDLLDAKKFKEALMLAQDVNKIAGEIETHRRLKALDLAKQEKINETLKATVSESAKTTHQ